MRKLYWFVKFVTAMKRLPEDDDLERVMCKQAGKPGHRQCGWSRKQGLPKFMCIGNDYPGGISHNPGKEK